MLQIPYTVSFDLFQVETIIQSLGLYNARDMIVGNNMKRGVSGGERRRVTSGKCSHGEDSEEIEAILLRRR